MNRVAIQPRMIAWARERSGLDAAALMKRFPAYEAWERGDKQPTLRQLEDLARKTLTPFGFFFLPEPPEEKLPLPDFRTLGSRPISRPSPNLLETVYTMQRRQQWMTEYLQGLGAEPLEFVGSATERTPVAAVAASIRETLGLVDGCAKEHATWELALAGLRRVIEAAGVLVMVNGVVGLNNRRKLDPDEFRGFVLSDRFAPLIFVNGADLSPRRCSRLRTSWRTFGLAGMQSSICRISSQDKTSWSGRAMRSRGKCSSPSASYVSVGQR